MVDRLNKRWDLVALGVLAYACIGTIYSWSIFREPLERAIGMSAAQSGLPYSLFLGVFAFSMPIAGILIERIGTRNVLWAGAILVGAGWIGAGLSQSFGALVLLYGGLGGLGVGLCYGVPLAVVKSWFPQRRGLAMGITLTGFGMSPFVTAPVGSALVGAFGVRVAMISLGIAFTGILVTVAPFLRSSGERTDPETPATSAGASPEAPSVPAILRSGSFVALWICFAIGTLSGLTAIGMTASFALSVTGLSPSTAALSVALLGIANGVGRPLFGTVHDRLTTRGTMTLAYGVVAAGALFGIIALQGGRLPFFLSFATLWLMLGGWLAIAPAATVRLFGEASYTRIYGFVYTAYGVGALVGGAVASAALERFGSYAPLFVAIIVLCLVGTLVARSAALAPEGTAHSLQPQGSAAGGG